MTHLDNEGRWEDIDHIICRPSPFTAPGFQPDTLDSRENLEFLLNESRICIIGAGGLGCELLKDLALMGFRNIDVIDMDEIDYSNLNRQFLFREDDVGKSKAEVAAAFINKRIPGANVVGWYKKIQDMPYDFWEDFQIIIAGLDNIEARRWMNATIVNMVEMDDNNNPIPDTIIPFIDGGTEGWKGQSRVIIPKMTPCFECLLDLFPRDPLNFPMCTIANTPRQPEHCIQYAFLILWENERPGEKVDGDNADHIQWIYEKAVIRAEEFGITGVTYKLTQGVVKHIIPAIASTNAVISASCATEAFKIATLGATSLENYMMYSGSEGLYTSTIKYEKNENCLSCGNPERELTVSPDITVEEFIVELQENESFQLKKPSLRAPGVTIYMQMPPSLEKQTRGNLTKALVEFAEDGQIVNVSDPSLPERTIAIKLRYTEGTEVISRSKN